mmetsp:Transcript_11917/g.32923  ORF Transcript_11917/g.32923 Transcript_11917/m.32923 type:complete len:121 (+) Transcript_11917:1342-1704(+)
MQEMFVNSWRATVQADNGRGAETETGRDTLGNRLAAKASLGLVTEAHLQIPPTPKRDTSTKFGLARVVLVRMIIASRTLSIQSLINTCAACATGTSCTMVEWCVVEVVVVAVDLPCAGAA